MFIQGLFLHVTISLLIKGHSIGLVIFIQGLFLQLLITFIIKGHSVGLVVFIQGLFLCVTIAFIKGLPVARFVLWSLLFDKVAVRPTSDYTFPTIE